MNRVNIYRSASKNQTSVPNLFIDEYMKDANDAQVKIYLFLIRMMNADLPTSVTDIADKFNYTEKDVLRALMYWESKQLLSLDYDASNNLTGIQILPVECLGEQQRASERITPVLPFAAQEPEKPVKAPISASDKPAYSLDELKAFRNNEEIEQLLMVTEQYIGKPLTRNDIETIFFMYDRLGFSTDLIDYLVQHCVEHGKKSLRYMEKVALSWHEQGIISPEDAKNSSRKHDKIVYSIMKSLGKTSDPAPKELEYINKWTEEYGFLLDVIQEACDKTVMTTDSHRFAYADGILSKWYKAGVHSKADIPLADSSYRRSAQPQVKNTKNKFNNFSQNNYDFEKLEKNILSN